MSIAQRSQYIYVFLITISILSLITCASPKTSYRTYVGDTVKDDNETKITYASPKTSYRTYVGDIVKDDNETDFMTGFDKRYSTVQKELEDAGIKNDMYSFQGGFIVTEDLNVIKQIARYKAYLNINSTGIDYWAITIIMPESGNRVCITMDPFELKSDFKWWESSIEIKESNLALDKLCKIVDDNNEFVKMTREELLSLFQPIEGASYGMRLKYKYIKLNENPMLIYALIQKGFYVYGDCYYMRLSID